MFLARGKLMAMLWLVGLLLGSGFAIAGAETLKWRLLNLLIILACMGVGLAIGYAAGLGSKNLGRVPNEGLPFSMMFGIVAALVCVRWNTSRAK
jgi:hypothetical protein